MKSVLAKVSVWNIVGGMILMWILGFQLFGWSTGGAAVIKADAAVATALTPHCVATAQADPLYETRKAELTAASSYQRPGLVGGYGWATSPGASKPNVAVAKECSAQVLL